MFNEVTIEHVRKQLLANKQLLKEHIIDNEVANSHRTFFIDKLTNLPNKNFFDNYFHLIILSMIESMLIDKENHTKENTYTILYCDINGLKVVNDVLGHSHADLGINKIAEIISHSIRTNREDKNDILFYTEDIKRNIAIKIGGDEFLIILPKCNKEQAKEHVEDRIKKNIYDNFEETKHLSLSIGAADTTEIEIPKDLSPDTLSAFFVKLLKMAEDRMYKDKRELSKSISTNEKDQFILQNMLRISDMLGLHFNKDFDQLIEIITNVKDNYIHKER